MSFKSMGKFSRQILEQLLWLSLLPLTTYKATIFQKNLLAIFFPFIKNVNAFILYKKHLQHFWHSIHDKYIICYSSRKRYQVKSYQNIFSGINPKTTTIICDSIKVVLKSVCTHVCIFQMLDTGWVVKFETGGESGRKKSTPL